MKTAGFRSPSTSEAKKKDNTPRVVTEYKLIQRDGVVTIKCLAVKGKSKRFKDDFEAIRESFALTLTRRW